MALEPEPIEAAAPGETEKEAVEEQTFNQDSRDEMEAAFEAFQSSDGVPAETAEEAPVIPDKPPAEVTPVEVTTEEPRTTFKTLEDADRSYLEVRRKWNETTERANRLEREKNEAERRASEAIDFAMKAAQGGRIAPQPEGQPQPVLTKEDIEAKFYEDPVGFQIALNDALLRENNRRMEQRTIQERRAIVAQNVTNSTQAYFDTNYSDLKSLEPLVMEEVARVTQDPDKLRPILEDRNIRLDVKAKALVDEASRRIRERLPDILAGLGASTGKTIKTRLTSGGPPLVPGGGRSGPSVNADVARTEGETNDEYIAGRLKQQDRMQVTRWTR